MKLLLSYDSKIVNRLSLFREILISLGHDIYDFDLLIDYNLEQINKEELRAIHQNYIIQRRKMISEADAILVLNFKDGNGETNIGVDEIIDIYEAFRQNKAIFIYNQISNKKIKREIQKFEPIYIDGNVKKIVDPFTEIYPILEYLSEHGEQLLETIPVKLGIDKEKYDRLLRQAEIKKWIFIDRWECFDTVELTQEGKMKMNPWDYKPYHLKPTLVGGIK